MPTGPFTDEGSRVVTLDAFDVIFRNELKRAVRARNVLTLLLLDTTPVPRHERLNVVHQLATLVASDVRETDVVAEGDSGRVWLLLLDTDLRSSMPVVDRIMGRVRRHAFSVPIGLDIGAACYPTHGADADALRRAADMRAGREGSGAR